MRRAISCVCIQDYFCEREVLFWNPIVTLSKSFSCFSQALSLEPFQGKASYQYGSIAFLFNLVCLLIIVLVGDCQRTTSRSVILARASTRMRRLFRQQQAVLRSCLLIMPATSSVGRDQKRPRQIHTLERVATLFCELRHDARNAPTYF